MPLTGGRHSCQGANLVDDNAVCAAWKYCEHHWFQNITKEVLCVVTVLISHQINEVESIDSPNNDQHEFWFPICCFAF
jgi:hypothetical protein